MQFERQEYQQECIGNIIEIVSDFDFENPSVENLKGCLKDFHKHNPQPVKKISDNLNLDILMETGTGKTFTYLNAIFAINKEYNQKKFIIFVPRKAILESVKQNISLTRSYFYSEFGKYLKEYYYVNEKSIDTIINHYINNSDELSVLVLTNSSVDKKGNILNRQHERSLFSSNGTTLDAIVALNPICFIDEPHLLKGVHFSSVFKKFKNLHFRFGATFPKEKGHELSNMIYCLDSKSAFENYLVKKISVHTLSSDSLMPILISFSMREKKAQFRYFISNYEYEIEVAFSDDLGAKLSFNHWLGVSISNAKGDTLYLNNGEEIKKSEDSYVLDEQEITHLMKAAIDLHFEKEMRLFKKGIKALCLFFIPNISDFRGANARIKNIFEKLYKQKREEILGNKYLNKEYRQYLQKDFNDKNELVIAQGYFSGDKGSSEEKEAQGISLILKEKEKLLSFKTPLRFIFSVWALQEGWDNPNIFTLVKLANSSSEISRHQQVGRGLRLCVNQSGKRIDFKHENENDIKFYAINALDVLVSAKERFFIEELQQEIESNSFNNNVINEATFKNQGLNRSQISRVLVRLEDKGLIKQKDDENYIINEPISEFIENDDETKRLLGEKAQNAIKYFRYLESKQSKNKNINKTAQIEDANKPKTSITIRKKLAHKFRELWQSISMEAKISYENINIQKLINEIVLCYNKEKITQNKVVIIKKEYNPHTNKIEEKTYTSIQSIKHDKKDVIKNLLGFAKSEKLLPLRIILQIYKQLNQNNFNANPTESMLVIQNLLKEKIHEHIISCVTYKFSETKISNEDLIYDESGEIKNKITPFTLLGKNMDNNPAPPQYLYNEVVYDSLSEKESILNLPKSIDSYNIKVFAKLPKLSIPTPYKAYSPDFAYLLQNNEDKKIFLICENKGYDSINDIPIKEQHKIDYAKKFFESLQKKLGDKVKINFQTRINNKNLLDLLDSVINET